MFLQHHNTDDSQRSIVLIHIIPYVCMCFHLFYHDGAIISRALLKLSTNVIFDLTCLSVPVPLQYFFSSSYFYRLQVLPAGSRVLFPMTIHKSIVRCKIFGTISLLRFLFAAFGKTLPLACHRTLTGNRLWFKIVGYYLF